MEFDIRGSRQPAFVMMGRAWSVIASEPEVRCVPASVPCIRCRFSESARVTSLSRVEADWHRCLALVSAGTISFEHEQI